MNQMQQQAQEKRGNVPFAIIPIQEFDVNNLPPIVPAWNMDNSYINSQLSYSLINAYNMPTERKDITASCLLGFLGCCDNLKLVMGPYCNAHQSLLFKRRFVSITGDGTCPITSCGNCIMDSRPTMFLTSTMPVRDTEDDIMECLSDLTRNIDTHNLSNILKFFTLLVSPENAWNMDSYLKGFQKYIADISKDYFQYVKQYREIIERALVPIVVSPKYFERIQDSYFWRTVFDKVEKRGIKAIVRSNNINNNISALAANRESKVIYNIPLSMFNILDILTILSFNFDIRTGCTIGYLPNAMIHDGIFVIGSATGIHNSLKKINKPNFCAYSPNVAKSLNEIFHVTNHNLDYIILNIIPSVQKHEAIHVLAIAEMRNIKPKDFYLEKITRKDPFHSLVLGHTMKVFSQKV